MRDTAASPGGRAFRYDCRTPHEIAAVTGGRRHEIFKTAERPSMPVFICAIGGAAAFEPYIRACPSLPIIFDHCGVPQSEEDFDALLRLAAYPNLHLKWCHAPLMFRARNFPFAETRPYLARALEAFGRERLMWASEFHRGRLWCQGPQRTGVELQLGRRALPYALQPRAVRGRSAMGA